MLGASGSRHLARRRSSPNVNPLLVAHLQSRKLSTAKEEDEESPEIHSGHSRKKSYESSNETPVDGKGVKQINGTTPTKNASDKPTENTENGTPPTQSGRSPNAQDSRKQSTTESVGSTIQKSKSNGQSSVARRQSRLSIVEGVPGGRMRQRRKAVEISDQRACVLLHSRLKGMKLEDIA